MLSRYRTKQRYYIAILAVFVGFVSIGFAAFSDVLTISSNALIRPDASSFRVVFSASATSLVATTVKGTGTGGAEGGSATINNNGDTPTISNLLAKFTEDGQSVTYTFYVHNAGAYTAYLSDITFNYVDGENKAKVCTAIDSSNTSNSLLTAACNDIMLTVAVGNTEATGTMTGISGNSLDKNAYKPVVLTISYASNDNLSDGDFTVEFGDITLTYSSKDNEASAPNLISFTVDGTTFSAEEGMTWGEWVASVYNTDGYIVDVESYDEIVSSDGRTVDSISLGGSFVYADDVIISGKSYYLGV